MAMIAPKGGEGGAMDLFFHYVAGSFNEFAGPILLSNSILYCSVLVILQSYVRLIFAPERVSKYSPRLGKTARIVALDALILQCYFENDLPFALECYVRPRPFCVTLLLVFVDTCLFFIADRVKLESMHDGQRSRSFEPIDLANDEDAEQLVSETHATNKYHDVTLRLSRVIPVFCVQLGLIMFYIESFNANPDLMSLSKFKPGYWIVAFIFQVHLSEKQFGHPFRNCFWHKLFAEKRIASAKHMVFTHLLITYRLEWRFRQVMDFVINGLGRGVIFYTFPILLSVEGPLDFVKDCTAVFFITTLDDLDVVKDLTEICITLKFQIFWQEAHRHDQNDCSPSKKLMDSVPVPLNDAEKLYAEKHLNTFSRFAWACDDVILWRRLLADTVSDAEQGREAFDKLRRSATQMCLKEPLISVADQKTVGRDGTEIALTSASLKTHLINRLRWWTKLVSQIKGTQIRTSK